MKTLLSIFIYLFFLVCKGEDNVIINLSWSPSCQNNVVGYKIYYGRTNINIFTNPSFSIRTNECSQGKDVTNFFYLSNFPTVLYAGNSTSYTVSNLQCGLYYYFAVTAYDSIGMESDFSSQAWIKLPDAYTNGGVLPKQNFSPSSYTTNWFAQPLITTNRNGIISTNYYSLNVKTFRLVSDLYVRTNWFILMNTNLNTTNWFVYKSGSNSIPNATITNVGGAAFFKIKI